jgi:hypothetical protein
MASIIGVETLQHTNGTTAATIDSSGFLLPKTPALSVQATDIDQSVSAQTRTVVDFETVVLDTLSGWNASNNRYTPTVAGYYAYGGFIRGNFSSVQQYINTEVRKNGDTSPIAGHLQFQSNADFLSNGSIPIPSGIVQMNGSSDYIDVLLSSDEACTISDNAYYPTHFYMFLVHAT